MRTDQENKIEALEQELSEMKVLLQAQSEKKPSKYVVKLKDTASRTLLNVIDDLPTTMIGIGTAASILVANWPNIDQSTMMEAVGIGSLGAASNSKVAPKPTLEDNYLNDTEELG